MAIIRKNYNAYRKYEAIVRNMFHAVLPKTFCMVRDGGISSSYMPDVSCDGTYLDDGNDGCVAVFNSNEGFQKYYFPDCEQYEVKNFSNGIVAFMLVSGSFFLEDSPVVQQTFAALQKLNKTPPEERTRIVRELFSHSQLLIDCFKQDEAWKNIFRLYGYDPRPELRICLYEFFRPFAGKIRIPPIVQEGIDDSVDVIAEFKGEARAVLRLPVDKGLPLLLEKVRKAAAVFREELTKACLESLWKLPEGQLQLYGLETEKDFYTYIQSSPMAAYLDKKF